MPTQVDVDVPRHFAVRNGKTTTTWRHKERRGSIPRRGESCIRKRDRLMGSYWRNVTHKYMRLHPFPFSNENYTFVRVSGLQWQAKFCFRRATAYGGLRDSRTYYIKRGPANQNELGIDGAYCCSALNFAQRETEMLDHRAARFPQRTFLGKSFASSKVRRPPSSFRAIERRVSFATLGSSFVIPAVVSRAQSLLTWTSIDDLVLRIRPLTVLRCRRVAARRFALLNERPR